MIGRLCSKRPLSALRNWRSLNRCFASDSTKGFNLRIVFGSQSGTAEAFASELEFDAQEANIKTDLIDALKFSANDLVPKSGENNVTAFIMACYGEGEPTDNSKKFFESLEKVSAAEGKKFNTSKFAVFGLGNSQCFRERYNVVGKALDNRLEELGGHRILKLGLGDASPAAVGSESMGECFAAWKKDLLITVSNMNNSTEPQSDAPKQAETVVSSANSPIVTNNVTLSSEVPIVLSARQQAMVPANRVILSTTVSHVTQLFSRTDEMTAAVEVEFDLPRTTTLYPSSFPSEYNYYTQGLQPGDHIGVFAPNSKQVVERFALAAGINPTELDSPVGGSDDATTLRQMLTWQIHLSGVASITSIKLLQRWLKDQPNLPLTAALFSQLESKYDALVRDKGLDTAAILDMIPKLPGANGAPPAKPPIATLLKALPTLNPRLYSITHMVLPSEVAAASAAAAHACPIAKALQKSIHTPTAADDYTKITLLCRLLRYRQTKSSANRIVDGVCSSYLAERLVPGESKVAIFFRESNFHLPPPVSKSSTAIPAPVIMISGGSGLAPFMSFLEERQRQLEKPDVKIGPAFLYFGCRTNDEYIFRDKLLSYLGSSDQGDKCNALDRLVVSFSYHHEGRVSTTEPLHSREVVSPREQHIPDVFKADKEYFLPLLRQGAHVYVCGGAGNFGKAVREAVNQAAIEAFAISTVNDAGGHPGIKYLIENKRFFEDLAD
ncbi:hypothetical protein EON65_04560 [archaeon]|nr:MAG: hypothetical protein EON65_04560 [archaeon]